MALWAKINRLPELPRQLIYNKFDETFIECKRFVLVSFEECEWSELDSSNPDIDKCRQLVNKVKSKLNFEQSFQDFVDRKEFEKSFHHVCTNFVQIIDQVQQFRYFLDQIFTDHHLDDEPLDEPEPEVPETTETNDIPDIRDLAKYLRQTDDHQHLAQFLCCVIDLVTKTTEIQNAVNGNGQVHCPRIEEVFFHFNTLLQILRTLPDLFVKVRHEWKEQYKMFLLGYPFSNYLDLIQYAFERVIEIILKNRALTVDPNGFINYHEKSVIQMFTLEFDSILQKLLNKSFIIEQQPCVVNKMNKIRINCRFLFGCELTGCQLTANIQPVVLKSRGKDVNVEQVMSTDNLDLIIKNKFCFDGLKLNGFKRTSSSEPFVTQEMSKFNFQGQVTLNSGQLNIITTFHEESHPVSVISHTSQEAAAMGAITWYYHIGMDQQKDSEETVELFLVKSILNDMFVNRFGPKSGLTNKNLEFLETKLMGDNRPNSGTVSRGQLIDVKINGTGKRKVLSFWDYFYHAHKLTVDHLQDLWKDGLIVGFISKQESERILSKCPPGTFLLRFSESEQGGVGISFYDKNKLENLNPFIMANLENRKLADLLRNCRVEDEPDRDIFTYIYTANGELKNKHHALKNHYSSIEKGGTDSDYLHGLIQVLIPKRVKKIQREKSR